MSRAIVICALLLAASAAHAGELHLVVVPDDGCPTELAVREAVARLVPELRPPRSVDASVSDLGDRYRVVIDGFERIVKDPARDCPARARTIAVALAVALAPPTLALPGPTRLALAPPPALPPTDRQSWLVEEHAARARSRIHAGKVLTGVGAGCGVVAAIGAIMMTGSAVSAGVILLAAFAFHGTVLLPSGITLWSLGASERRMLLAPESSWLAIARRRRNAGSGLLAVGSALIVAAIAGTTMILLGGGLVSHGTPASFTDGMLFLASLGPVGLVAMGVGSALIAPARRDLALAIAPTGLALQF